MTTTCARCGLFHPAGMACATQRLAIGAEQYLVPGALLAGRYHIVRTIHQGGMSVVYQATDALMRDRPVVVKELRLPNSTGSTERLEAEAWFAREAYILSSLRNPLIPEFYSAFTEAGGSYIVQEYVAGENLNEVVQARGPIAEQYVVEWALSLCGLLQYLHELDEPVLYRDLKPANILLCDGAASLPGDTAPLKLVDFGIARHYQRGMVGTVIGTPGYAPPEQYQGLATPESDIYALGATMHRLLTGYDPEHGTPFVFPPVRSLNPLVSAGLAEVVERAVQLDSARRYASAADMGDAVFNLAWNSRRSRGEHAQTGATPHQHVYSSGNMRARKAFRWTALLVCVMMVAPGLLTLMSGMSASRDDTTNQEPALPVGQWIGPTVLAQAEFLSPPGNCAMLGTNLPYGAITHPIFGICDGRPIARITIAADHVAGVGFTPRIIKIQRGDVVRFDWTISECSILPWSNAIGFAGAFLELSFDTAGYYAFTCGTRPDVGGAIQVH